MARVQEKQLEHMTDPAHFTSLYPKNILSRRSGAGHVSSLVFCRENVDPDFVTAELGLQPTSTQ